MTRNALIIGGLGAAALLLSGCGSDSSSTASGASTPPITTTPAEGAEGTWRGNINTPVANSRLMEAFILGDGEFWMAYSTANDPTQTDALINAAGILHGTASPKADGSFSIGNARHISLEDGNRNSVGIAGNYVTGSSLTGTLTQSPALPGSSLPATAEFASLYRTAYNNNLTLAHLAGPYTGSLTTNFGKNSSTITFDSVGVITGSDNSGCTFQGQAATRDRGNVFDIDITVGSEAGCGANAGKAMSGVLSLESSRAGMLALDTEQKLSFIFVGTR